MTLALEGFTPDEAAEVLGDFLAAAVFCPDALDFIARQEALDRGWYAGAVGALGGGRAHLCVPLRCALLDGATARLFVGAGLVAGSTAPAEWDETQRKAAPMLDALGVGP